MRLLHVISSTDPESGGPIEAVRRISEVLLSDGHAIQAVSLESREEAAQRSLPFSVTGVGGGVGRYRYNPSLTRWLDRHAREFDVIVLHGLWNYSSLGSWRALRNQSTPYFIFAHGMMDPWFRDAYPLKHALKQAFWRLGEGRVLRDAKAVLFTCEEEKLRARGVFQGFNYRERIARLGTHEPDGDPAVQTAAFYAAMPALMGRRFMLFIGRIHPKKGCDLLVEAFAGEAAHLPADLDLVVAGPDQTGWVKELQKMAQRLDIADRVHWPGMVKGDEKWGAFRSADALVLPSHQENFGFVVAEAMACGRPVLISDKVNIWREVESAKAGLVAPDTVEGTRDLIRRFTALSAGERAGIGQNARNGFLRYFQAETSARDFLRVIETQ
ncbi:MAG TPA: glycosyltransferase [Terracidiphilus sp.]|nr:glycosyltransferase [Terracidiphilus sp.]